MAARSPRGAGGSPSQRQLRVGEIMRHALAEILQRNEIPDPVLETHPVTVPEVRMSPDLKHATAYVMPLGGMDQNAVIEALMRHRRYLRGVLAKKVEVKYMPDLRFEVDPSFEEARHIDELLRSPEVARDLDHDED